MNLCQNFTRNVDKTVVFCITFSNVSYFYDNHYISIHFQCLYSYLVRKEIENVDYFATIFVLSLIVPRPGSLSTAQVKSLKDEAGALRKTNEALKGKIEEEMPALRKQISDCEADKQARMNPQLPRSTCNPKPRV